MLRTREWGLLKTQPCSCHCFKTEGAGADGEESEEGSDPY